jgi:hypothetical protein
MMVQNLRVVEKQCDECLHKIYNKSMPMRSRSLRRTASLELLMSLRGERCCKSERNRAGCAIMSRSCRDIISQRESICGSAMLRERRSGRNSDVKISQFRMRNGTDWQEPHCSQAELLSLILATALITAFDARTSSEIRASARQMVNRTRCAAAAEESEPKNRRASPASISIWVCACSAAPEPRRWSLTD